MGDLSFPTPRDSFKAKISPSISFLRSNEFQPTLPTITVPATPLIPDALDDGLIPLGQTFTSLKVVAPVLRHESYLNHPGDIFFIAIDGRAIPDTERPLVSASHTAIDLEVPATVLASLPDGDHAVSFGVFFGDSLDTWSSLSQRITISRYAGGGHMLPRITFDESFEQSGVSLSSILTQASSQLLGTIPTYKNQDAGDKVELLFRVRGTRDHVAAGTFKVADAHASTRVHINAYDLERLGAHGAVEFFYFIIDKDGNRAGPSSPALLRMLTRNAPRILGEPTAQGVKTGAITDGDIRPLTFDIPASQPHAEAGDHIVLRINGRSYLAGPLSATEAGANPMTSITVPYDDVWAMADGKLSRRFDVACAFEVVRDGISSWSPLARYQIDLSVPGGRDPEPGTSINEGLPTPRLRTVLGGEDNIINIDAIDTPAMVVIPSAIDGKSTDVFKKGDEIVVMFNGRLTDAIATISQVSETRIEISTDLLHANLGTSKLSYVARRNLTDGSIVEVFSPTQNVRVFSAELLAGGGRRLQKSVFRSAKIAMHQFGAYALDTTRVVGADPHGPNVIRIYAYKNIAEGDQISLTIQGYKDLAGTESLPEAHGILEHTVSATDLRPRPDDLASDETQAVYVDLRVPSNILLPIIYGRAKASYEVRNAAGTAESEMDSVLVRRTRPITEAEERLGS